MANNHSDLHHLIIGYCHKVSKASKGVKFVTVPINVEHTGTKDTTIRRNIHKPPEKKPKLGFHCQASNLEGYSCDKCDFGTDFVAFLTKHVKESHSGGAPTHTKQVITGYVCDCGFETYSTLHWLRHLNRCSNRRKAQVVWFYCEKCSFRAKKVKDLQIHEMYIHSFNFDKENSSLNEMEHSYAHKGFNCRKCDFTSYYYSQLLIHRRELHKTERWFHCDKCNYKTKKKVQLVSHKEVSHGRIWIAYRQKRYTAILPFKCAQCPYANRTKRGLMWHETHRHQKYSKNSEIVNIAIKKLINCVKCIDHEHAYALKPHMCRCCSMPSFFPVRCLQFKYSSENFECQKCKLKEHVYFKTISADSCLKLCF